MAINAFVGHSFLPIDHDVVGKFLDFFDHVSRLGLDFSWDHAEGAEPKELSIKVKEKMEGKNLFIGICTARQRSIDFDKLKPVLLNRKRFWGSETDFATKTSDWILQEIGFAYGRNMKIMILLETGVKTPGGIQGDIEYISFERNNPERSFNKILEMLRSLTILPATIGMTEIIESERSVQQKAPPPKEEELEEKPISDWTDDDYEINLLLAIARKDSSKEEEIHKNYIKSDFASKPDSLLKWNARRLYLTMKWKKERHLDELLLLLEDNPNNPDVLFHIAQSYELYEEYERAAAYYQKSSSAVDETKDKIIQLSLASLAFAKSGDKEKANLLNKQCVSMVRELGKGTSFIYRSLADVANEIENADDYKVFAEAYLELSPEDHNQRFSLAYKYAEDGENEAAMFHYRILTERNPNSSNWNNLGVALANLRLSSLSVYAYREAEKIGETLAMSNLAFKFVNEGFLDEAMGLVNKATSMKEYSENIGSVIASIKTTKEKEEREQSQLIDSFKKIRQFYIDYSRTYLKDDLSSIPLNWQGSKCTFQVTINQGTFEANGVYDKPKPTGYSWSVPASSQKEIIAKEYIKYIGKVNGYSVKYEYWVSEGESPNTDSTKPKGKGVMIVDDVVKRIRIYEIGSKDKEGFSEMVLLNNETSHETPHETPPEKTS